MLNQRRLLRHDKMIICIRVNLEHVHIRRTNGWELLSTSLCCSLFRSLLFIPAILFPRETHDESLKCSSAKMSSAHSTILWGQYLCVHPIENSHFEKEKQIYSIHSVHIRLHQLLVIPFSFSTIASREDWDTLWGNLWVSIIQMTDGGKYKNRTHTHIYVCARKEKIWCNAHATLPTSDALGDTVAVTHLTHWLIQLVDFSAEFLPNALWKSNMPIFDQIVSRLFHPSSLLRCSIVYRSLPHSYYVRIEQKRSLYAYIV